MNQTYLKYGLVGALVLYVLSILAGFAGNILMSLVVISALGAAVADKIAKEKIKLCDAQISQVILSTAPIQRNIT